MKNACIYWDFEVEQRSIVTMHNGDSNNYECVGRQQCLLTLQLSCTYLSQKLLQVIIIEILHGKNFDCYILHYKGDILLTTGKIALHFSNRKKREREQRVFGVMGICYICLLHYIFSKGRGERGGGVWMGEVVKNFKLMKLKGRYFNFQGQVINYAENENDL